MIEIRFPSNISMDYPSLMSKSLLQCMNVPQGERVNMVLTDTQKVSAFGVAALAARLVWLIRAKKIPAGSTIRRPESGRVSNELMRMGLYSLLQEASVNVFTKKSVVERPQELWLFNNQEELEIAIPRLINLMKSVLPATDKDYDRLSGIWRLMASNVFAHSKSNTSAVICAQTYPNAGFVEFAVADTGQGIWNSLNRHESLRETIKNHAHAILTALTLKVKTAAGETRSGTLSTLLGTARQTEGEFICMSGDSALTLRKGEMRNISIAPWQGCAVGMRLRLLINGKDNTDPLLRSFLPPEEEILDDKKKEKK